MVVALIAFGADAVSVSEVLICASSLISGVRCSRAAGEEI